MNPRRVSPWCAMRALSIDSVPVWCYRRDETVADVEFQDAVQESGTAAEIRPAPRRGQDLAGHVRGMEPRDRQQETSRSRAQAGSRQSEAGGRPEAGSWKPEAPLAHVQ